MRIANGQLGRATCKPRRDSDKRRRRGRGGKDSVGGGFKVLLWGTGDDRRAVELD